MQIGTDRKQQESSPTLLELLLRLEGDIRGRLTPIRVTPLQAGVLLFLCRHAEANVTDAAAALGVRLPTMSTVVKDLVRTRWVTKRRSVKDDRVVCVSLSRRGHALARQIEQRLCHMHVTILFSSSLAGGVRSKSSAETTRTGKREPRGSREEVGRRKQSGICGIHEEI